MATSAPHLLLKAREKAIILRQEWGPKRKMKLPGDDRWSFMDPWIEWEEESCWRLFTSAQRERGRQERPFNLSGHSYALAGVLCSLLSGCDSSQPGYCCRRFTTLPAELSTPDPKQRSQPARIYKYWKGRRRERKRRLFMLAEGYFSSRYSQGSAGILWAYLTSMFICVCVAHVLPREDSIPATWNTSGSCCIKCCSLLTYESTKSRFGQLYLSGCKSC